jgi:hypothetical protein
MGLSYVTIVPPSQQRENFAITPFVFYSRFWLFAVSRTMVKSNTVHVFA